MSLPCKTPSAAIRAGGTYWQLVGLLRSGRIPRPSKDESGDYVWTDEDIAAAKFAIEQNSTRKMQKGGK